MQTLKPRIQTLTSRLATQPAPSKAGAYRIRGRTLQQIRKQHLTAQPLCVHCLPKGYVRAATQLDHIVPLHKGGTDTADNRQGLCDDCHKVKTLEDLKP